MSLPEWEEVCPECGLYEITLKEFDGKEAKFKCKHCEVSFTAKVSDKPDYQEAYNILIGYFDSISDEEKPEVDQRLKLVGL